MTQKQTMISVVCVIIALLLTFLFWYFLIKDEPPPDDSDLYLAFQPAASVNNGYLRLGEIGELVASNHHESNDLLSKTPFDVPAAQKMTVRYHQELVEFFKAAEYPNFGRDSKDIRPQKSVTYLGMLAQLQGKLTLSQGKSMEAANIGVNLIKLGYRYEHSNGYLIDGIIGTNFKKIGLELIEEILEKGLTHGQASEIGAQIRPYADSTQGYVQMFRSEYSYSRDLLRDWKLGYQEAAVKDSPVLLKFNSKLVQIAIQLPLFYKPNKTDRIFQNHYRQIIAVQTGKLQKLDQPPDYQPNFFSGNVTGEYMLALFTPYPDALITKIKQTEVRFQKLVQDLADK